MTPHKTRAAAQIRIGERAASALNLQPDDAVDALHCLLPTPPEDETSVPIERSPSVVSIAALVMSSPELRRDFAALNAFVSPGLDPLRFVRRYVDTAI